MIQIFTGYYPEHERLYQELYHLTQVIQIAYPDYEDWYHNTFLKGLKDGTRRYLIASQHGRLMGCCFIKDTPTEKKICTLYVAPEYRGKGIGTELLQTALKELDGTATLTVLGPTRPLLLPLLNKFGFHFNHISSNGSFDEFEYTTTPKKITTHHKNLPLAKHQNDSHQY